MTTKRCGIWKIKCYFSTSELIEGEVIYRTFLRNRVTLFQEGEPVLDIRQTSILELLIYNPIVKILLPFQCRRPLYHVFTSAGEIGASVAKVRSDGMVFDIQGSVYVLRQHSHNVGSLTKNEHQIARYERMRDQSILIEYDSETQPRLVLSFALLFYGLYHARYSRWRWHDTVFFHDENESLAHWHPKDANQV